MAMEFQQVFRNKAEELARLEASLVGRGEDEKGGITYQEKAQMNMIRLYVHGALAVLALVGLNFLHKWLMILCIALLVYALGEVYVFWKQSVLYKAMNVSKTAREDSVDSGKAKREALIGELNRLRSEHKELQGNYWWDAGVDPLLPIICTGDAMFPIDWDYSLLFPIRFQEIQGKGVRCNDFTKDGFFVSTKEILAMANSGKTMEIYRDDALLNSGADTWLGAILYALKDGPVTEVQAVTTTRHVNKAAEMAAYRSKLDAYERAENSLLGNFMLTNEEAFITGKLDANSYAGSSLFREALEERRAGQLDREDGATSTQYKEVYRNLFHGKYLPCAWVFMTAEGEARVASIQVLSGKQDVIEMTWRFTSDKDQGGFLESYAEYEALEIGKEKVAPGLGHVVNSLLAKGEKRTSLHIRKRDVLAPKPAGISEWDWCYLVWKDRDETVGNCMN